MAESISNQSESSANANSTRNSSMLTEEKPKKETKIYSNWTRLLRPWKWKRKKKSEKFTKTAADLERKISVRSTREDLIKRGVISEINPPETIHEPSDDDKKVNSSKNGQITPADISDKVEKIKISTESVSVDSTAVNDSVPSDVGTPPQPLKRTLQASEKSSTKESNNQFSSENIHSVVSNADSIKKPVAAKRTKKNVIVSDSNGKQSPPKPPPKPTKVSSSESEDNVVPNQETEVLFASKVEVIPSANDKDENLTSTTSSDNQLSEISEEEKSVVESDSESSIVYRDDTDEEDEDVPTGGLAAKVARKDTLALKLSNRSPVEKSSNDRTSVKRNISRHLSQRPTKSELQERNILPNETAEQRLKERDKVKRQLTKKLSMRPTVQELIERKVLHWHEYVEVYEVHHYDRRGDKPWTRLTASDKASIRKELNEFKANEMEVHEESKRFTRFHRP